MDREAFIKATPISPPHIESLPAYHAGLSAEGVMAAYGLDRVVKLASNESPIGPSPLAVLACNEAASSMHRYPDPQATALRRRLSESLGCDPSEVMVGHGSSELIDLCCRTFAGQEDHAIIGRPSFSCYAIYLRSAQVPVTEVPLRDQIHWDVDDLLAAVRPETRLLFVANPNNPTGTVMQPSALERLARELPPAVTLVVDEAYCDFAEPDAYRSAMALRSLRERLIVLRTFSKSHGLAALRVGYGVAPAHFVARMDRVRLPFNLSGAAQAAAIAALDDEDHLQRLVALNARERLRMTAALSSLGWRVVPSHANFLLVRVPEEGPAGGAEASKPAVSSSAGAPKAQRSDGMEMQAMPRSRAKAVYEALLRQGVIVRFLGGELDDALRISLGTEQENDALLAALKAVGVEDLGCRECGRAGQAEAEVPAVKPAGPLTTQGR